MPDLTTQQKVRRAKFGLMARENLLLFCQITSPATFGDLDVTNTAFDVQPHHKLIVEALTRVKQGTCKRLMIVCPPSHGKSTTAIHKFIPWVWGSMPDAKFLVLTYSASLAESHGKDVRKLMLSDEYKLPFGGTPAMLSPSSQSMNYLETMAGGKAWFEGLTGSVTGKHGHFILIDDPIKGSEEARSATTRDNVWQNLVEVVFTRRQSAETPIVLITTRWNLDDPAARLTDPNNPYCTSPEEWEVIHLRGYIATQEEADKDPLKRQVGEALWPMKMNASDYQKMMRSDVVTRNAFQTLYQGDPAPVTGSFFDAAWVVPYGPKDLPDSSMLKRYIGSDHAVRTEQANDSTCIIPAGYDSNGDLWVLPDVWWEKKTIDIVVDAMLDKMKLHQPLQWFSGKDHITGSIKPFLQRRQREEHVYCPIIELTDIRDKESKAQPLQGMMAQRRVHFPVFAPWWPAALKELMQFPKEGVPNDFCDSLANICRGLHMAVNGDGKKVSDIPKPGTWDWHTFGQQKPRETSWV